MTALRTDQLKNLKIKHLKILCSNRGINTERPNKEALIKLILTTKSIQFDYNKFNKQSLKLELKSKGIQHSKTISKTELIKLCNNNNTNKTKKNLLRQLTLSELQTLCQNRKIKLFSEYTCKTILCRLLQTTGVHDLMTTKQLIAEMRGRCLSTNGLKKEDMLKYLNSNITFQDQQLIKSLKTADAEIENTKKALQEFIAVAKQPLQEKKCIKHNERIIPPMLIPILDTAHNEINGLLHFTS